jgi:hypothetical protein
MASRVTNRSGKCLDCKGPILKPKRGRYPLYCVICRPFRELFGNRAAQQRHRAKVRA